MPLIFKINYNNFKAIYIENITKSRKETTTEKSFLNHLHSICEKIGIEKS